jgi:hypothetical protein
MVHKYHSLNIESNLNLADMFTSYTAVKDGYYTNELSEEEYRKERIDTFSDISNSANNFIKDKIKLLAITNLGVGLDGNEIYDLNVVTGDLNNEDIQREKNIAINKASYTVQTFDTSAVTASNDAYIKDEYKYQTVGKIYKQTNEVDSKYDYYFIDANNYFTSGDYLYNNDYEINDYVLMIDIQNASGLNILNYYPTSKDGTNGTFQVSYNFALQELSLAWQNDTGGSMDIMASTGSTYGNWGVFTNEPLRLWLPESHKSEFGLEFKMNQSDTSFTVQHKMDIMTEQYLVNRANYQHISSSSVY